MSFCSFAHIDKQHFSFYNVFISDNNINNIINWSMF